jgi:hypothetical protein
MTIKALFAALAALAFALPAVAQTAKPEAKPMEAKPAEVKPEAKPAEAKPAEAKPEAKAEHKPMARRANPKRSEDARHCLDKTSNTEIIKCAEEYL